MRLLLKPAALLLLLAGSVVLQAQTPPPATTKERPRIQAAILLDVSGSMEGLIKQAKEQLWNMVSVMGRARCAAGTPQVEVALYEYGRRTNDPQAGYVRQLSPFTTDLDELSKTLFRLTIDGSEEYCGHALYSAVTQLAWDPSPASYKVVFIAGNENFMQGYVDYTLACAEAQKRGVVVNTIYCGERLRGIDERWDLGNRCGAGSYTNINHNAQLEDVPTPYDSLLLTLNDRLNGTYLAFGTQGAAAYARQAEVDQLNFGLGRRVAAKRVAVKGHRVLYRNTDWDLVDAADKDSSLLARMDRRLLPDSLQGRSVAQLQQLVSRKKSERVAVQKEIETAHLKREAYLAQAPLPGTTAPEAGKAGASTLMTLETEIEKIIKEQVKRVGMEIK